MKVIKLDEIDTCNIQEYFEGVVVVPTETVYGLAARIDREEALENIFKVKGRPSDNPLIVHISSIDMLKDLVDEPISDEYQRLMEKFWPGPFSLLFKCKESVSRTVRGKYLNTVVIRMPKSKQLRDIIDILGCPLAIPSANTSGNPSPTTVQHVIDDFGESVALYIDGGPCEVGLESTVFGIVDSQYMLLRPGNITKEQIEETIGAPVVIMNKVPKNGIAQSPGQKYKHYSPSNPVYLFVGQKWLENMMKLRVENRSKKIGRLKQHGFEHDECFDQVYELGRNAAEYSRSIFAGLRSLDKTCDMIFVREFDLSHEGLAIMDRLEKAASFIIQ